MKYLHLTGGFEPTPRGQKCSILHQQFTFKGGEPHIKIEELPKDTEVMIAIRVGDFSDMGLLLLAVDALKRMGITKISLFIPYFPGARQDRLMVPGEPLTCKVYADLINNLNLTEVIIMDPHSDVTPAVLDNCTVLNNHKFVDLVINHIVEYVEDVDEMEYCIVSPDAGANKKVKALTKFLFEKDQSNGDGTDIVYCDKTRDVTTGKITAFTVAAEDLTGKTCIIVDDICDGGGTFLGLSKALRAKGASKIYLAATHGIFSRGFDALNEVVDGIFTTNSFFQEIYADAGTGPTTVPLSIFTC
jgi:ribose-phosphate pyrophosphokinase